MPNLLMTVLPKLAPNAKSIIERPILGSQPNTPSFTFSYVKMKWLMAVMQPTNVISALTVPNASEAISGEAVALTCTIKSL